jgi:hypothetical protein
VVAEVVLAGGVKGNGVLVHVSTRPGHDLDGGLREDCIADSLLSDDTRSCSDHLGL